MEILRNGLLSNLKEFALSGSGLIIGSPGIGKTHTLRHLEIILAQENIPHLFLRVDQLGDASEEEMRTRLGYKGNFLDSLKSFILSQKGKRGIFIIDGFDAARDERKRDRLIWYIKSLIEEQKGLWNVIVSVRTYDAKKSQELLELFGGFLERDPLVYRSPESNINCRHFFIPLLDEKEVKSVFVQIPHLEDLYNVGSLTFRKLLCLPFNLWLIEKLLAKGMDFSKFSNVSSETQLLGLFWDQRIVKSSDKDNRQFLLTKITSEMIKRKSLYAKKESVYDAGIQNSWVGLMSDEIIVDFEQQIAFKHNILFDYAVSVLIIEDSPEQIIKFVTEDSSRPLFLRPSITYYLTRLWYDNNDLFWKTFWYILPSRDPYLKLFSKTIPPNVLINEATKISQLNPLITAHERNDINSADAILRLLQSFRTFDNPRDDLWIIFFDKISSNIQEIFVWDLTTIVSDILTRALKGGNKEIIEIAASISRKILFWIWKVRTTKNQNFLDQLGSVWLVPMVSKTFYTSPEESKELLENVLSLINEENFPINYIYRLSDSINQIWPYDSQFISVIYLKVFGYEEKSTDMTHMGGIVLPLTSTRRQDYEMCHFVLIKKFPAFLKVSPEIATETVIKLLNQYVIIHHVIPYLKPGKELKNIYESFKFGNKICTYLSDMSYMWDASEYQDRPIEMAKNLFGYIEELAHDSRLDTLDKVLTIFKDNVQIAYFWKKLLKVGRKEPKVFAERLFDLLIAKPVLEGHDAIYELGEFLKVAYAYLPQEKRRILERAILKLCDVEDDKGKKYLVEDCNRLLACLPSEYLVSPDAIRFKAELEKNGLPDNRPLVQFYSSSKPFTTEDWLKEQGVDLDNVKNKKIKQHFETLDEYVSKWMNKKTELRDVQEILPVAQKLYESLTVTKDAEEPILERGWSKLGSCVATFCKIAKELSSETYIFSRTVMLECAKHPSPKPTENEEENYRFPSWGDSPRIEAAQGLCWLANREPKDSEVIDAIDKLVFDQVPSVRFLTVRYLTLLLENSSEHFWELMIRIAKSEKNVVVKLGLCEVIGKIWYKYEKECIDILRIIISDKEILYTESEVSEYITHLLVALMLAKDNQWATNLLNEILEDPLRFAAAFNYASEYLVREITPDNFLSATKKDVEVANKALFWQEKFLNASSKAMTELIKSVNKQWTDDSRGKLKKLYDPIDNTITRFYFSADVNESLRKEENKVLSDGERKQFYFKIKPLLEKILTFSSDEENGILFAPTAHYYMELLNGVLKYDPQGVLHLANKVAKASEKFNYNLDSFAIREVVKLVESILADYRSYVREGQSLDDLLELLDIFAKVGWIEALRLVGRLDEIFR